MSYYDTVTDVNPRPLTVDVAYTFCSGHWWYETMSRSAPQAPPSESRLVPLNQHDSWKVPSSDPQSWAAIRNSGAIKMTRYSRGSRSVVFSKASFQRIIPGSWITHSVRQICGGVMTCRYKNEPDLSYTTYTCNVCSDSVPSFFTFHRVGAMPINDKLNAAIIAARNRAVSQSEKTWDALTELAEMRENVSSAHSLLKEGTDYLSSFFKDENARAHSGKNAKSLLRSADPFLRSLGRKWMTYRYFLMPLLYSYEDIMRVMAQRNTTYRTVRSSDSFSISEETSPGSDFSVVEKYQEDFDIRVTIKSSFTHGTLRSTFDQININPFTTAWELIPMSFVIDWFVNIGDWINSMTRVDMSSLKVACYSVKRKGSKIESLVVDHESKPTVTIAAYDPCYPADTKVSKDLGAVSMSSQLRVETWETYDRYLFIPTVQLQFNVFIDWKRAIDAIVLSSEELRTILRRIK